MLAAENDEMEFIHLYDINSNIQLVAAIIREHTFYHKKIPLIIFLFYAAFMFYII